jgi:hypothetical protein
MILLAVVTLLAGTIHSEEVTGASAVTSLDTRSYTEDWSSEVRLYTKKIVGTVILVY